MATRSLVLTMIVALSMTSGSVAIAAPSKATLVKAIKSTTEAINGTRARWDRVVIKKVGPMSRGKTQQCVPVMVDAEFTAFDHRGRTKHCRLKRADWTVCRRKTKSRYEKKGKWGPWSLWIGGFYTKC